MKNKDYWRLKTVLAEDYRQLSYEEDNAGYKELYKELADFLEENPPAVTQTSLLNEKI